MDRVYEGDDRTDIQLALKCDFYYSVYTHLLQGSSIRLNAKRDDTFPLYHLIGHIGEGNPDPKLVELVNLHLELQYSFQDVGLSGMK